MQNPFGTITPPSFIAQHGTGATAIVSILNIGLRILIVIAGVYALINLILAGYQFISAGGDSEAIMRAWNRIWQTLVGLLVVAGSFLIAAIAGQLIFGDAGVILDPARFLP